MPSDNPTSGGLHRAQPAAGLSNNGQQRSQRRRVSLNSLKLHDKLGSGTFGAVFKCTWQKQRLAVKTYHRSDGRKGSCAERELAVLLRLHHASPAKCPSICHLFAYRKTRLNKYFLFFELFSCDLSTYIIDVKKRGDVIDARQAISWTRNLSGGVAFLHSHCIIHRDLKPANILLRDLGDAPLAAATAEQSQQLAAPDQCQPAATSEQWQAVIADFGNSAIVQRSIRHCTLDASWDSSGRALSRDVCTLCYAAPEMLVPGATYGHPVDIWSLGLVLLEVEAREVACPARPRAPDWEQLQAYWHLCQPAAAWMPSSSLVNSVRKMLERRNGFPRRVIGTFGLRMATGRRVRRRSEVGEVYGPQFRAFAFRLLHFEPIMREPSSVLSARCEQSFQRYANTRLW